MSKYGYVSRPLLVANHFFDVMCHTLCGATTQVYPHVSTF